MEGMDREPKLSRASTANGPLSASRRSRDRVRQDVTPKPDVDPRGLAEQLRALAVGLVAEGGDDAPSPRNYKPPPADDLPSDAEALAALAQDLRQRLATAVTAGHQLLSGLEYQRTESKRLQRELQDVVQLYDEGVSTSVAQLQSENKQLARQLRDCKSQINQLQISNDQLRQEADDEREIQEREAALLQAKQAEMQQDQKWVEEQAALAYEAAEKANQEAATDFTKLARVMRGFSTKALTAEYFRKLKCWRDDNKKRRHAFAVLIANSQSLMQWKQDRMTDSWRRLRGWAVRRSYLKERQREHFCHRAEAETLRLALDAGHGLGAMLADMTHQSALLWFDAERRVAAGRRAAAAAAADSADELKRSMAAAADERAGAEERWTADMAVARAAVVRLEQKARQVQEQSDAEREKEVEDVRRHWESQTDELRRALDDERQSNRDWERRRREELSEALAEARSSAAEAQHQLLAKATSATEGATEGSQEIVARMREECERKVGAAESEREALKEACGRLSQELAAAKQVHGVQLRDARTALDHRRRRELREQSERRDVEAEERADRREIAADAEGTVQWCCALHWRSAVAEWQRGWQRERAAAADRKRVAAEHQTAMREAGEQRLRCDERAQRERAAATAAAADAIAARRERDAAVGESQELRKECATLRDRSDVLTGVARQREDDAALARHTLTLARAAAVRRKQKGGDADVTGALGRALDLAQGLRQHAAQTELQLRSPERRSMITSPSPPVSPAPHLARSFSSGRPVDLSTPPRNTR